MAPRFPRLRGVARLALPIDRPAAALDAEVIGGPAGTG